MKQLHAALLMSRIFFFGSKMRSIVFLISEKSDKYYVYSSSIGANHNVLHKSHILLRLSFFLQSKKVFFTTAMAPYLVLITGANRGIDQGLVKYFLKNKEHVIATARVSTKAKVSTYM